MSYQPKTDWKYDDTPTETDFNRIERGVGDAHTKLGAQDGALEDLEDKIDNMYALTDGPITKTWTDAGEAWKTPNYSLDNLTVTGIYFAFDNYLNTGNLHKFPVSQNNKYIIYVTKSAPIGGLVGQVYITQVAYGTDSTGEVYTRTSNYDEIFQMPWTKMTASYQRVAIHPMTGWIGNNIQLIRWGDVVTVYGSVRPTSTGTWRAMFQIPSGYRVNYTLAPFPMYGYLSNNTTEAMFMGVMQGDGEVLLVATPVSGISLTQNMYFNFSYILPRSQ